MGVIEIFMSFFYLAVMIYIAEIRDYICQTKKGAKKASIDVLCQLGYKIGDITQELDHQCSWSTLRYISSDDTYAGYLLG